MKMLINFILLVIISNTSIANDSIIVDSALANKIAYINSEIFKQVNIYRIENNLAPLSYDARADSIGINHTTYTSKIGLLEHHQEFDVPNFNEVFDFGDRYAAYGITDYYLIGENLQLVSDSVDISADEIVNRTIKGWKESPEHNSFMLDPLINKGAISTTKGNFISYFGDINEPFLIKVHSYAYWISLEAFGE